jgi:hypothetical protein
MSIVIATNDTIAMLVRNDAPVARVTAADRQMIDSANLMAIMCVYSAR